jgi:hypothetical protein
MSSGESIYLRFKRFAVNHGIPATKAAYNAYELFCAANPGHWVCGSKASLMAWLGNSSGTKAVAAAPRAAPRQPVASAVSYGTNLKVRHRVSCEGGNLVISSTDMVATVTTPGTVTVGTNLLTFYFHPDAPQFIGSRMAAFANLYEKYNLRKLRFHFQPAVATSTNGSVTMAWDNDPGDNAVAASDAGVRQLMSYESNVTSSLWAPATLSCKLDPSTMSLFTSSGGQANRLHMAGMLQMAALAGVPSNTAIGTVWVDYECVFSSPSELSAGPSDESNLMFLQAATVYPAGSSLLNVMSASSGTQVTNGINQGFDSMGRVSWLLPPGAYFVEVILNGQTTAIATTLQVLSTVVTGAATANIVTGTFNHLTTTPTAATTCVGRWGVVVSGSGVIALYNALSATATFAGAWMRVVAADVQFVNSFDVDSYSF